MAHHTVERLMRQTGLRGVIRAKSPRATWLATEIARPADLVNHQFTTVRPARQAQGLTLADLDE